MNMDSIFQRIDKRGERECWPWSGGTDGGGYPVVRRPRSRKNIKVHRLVYAHKVGPIPSGMEIDHACRNLLCCNPAHMRAVTHAQNCMNRVYRGSSGIPGAHWNKRSGRWYSAIKNGRRQIHLGTFNTAEEAGAAYAKKKAELHGEFCPIELRS